jgi:hypothetical protein
MPATKKKLTLRRFWPGCSAEFFAQRHPELAALGVEIVDHLTDADICVYSVFGEAPATDRL